MAILTENGECLRNIMLRILSQAASERLESEMTRVAADQNCGKYLGHVLSRFERQRARAVEIPEIALLNRVEHRACHGLSHLARAAVIRGQGQHDGTAG